MDSRSSWSLPSCLERMEFVFRVYKNPRTRNTTLNFWVTIITRYQIHKYLTLTICLSLINCASNNCYCAIYWARVTTVLTNSAKLVDPMPSEICVGWWLTADISVFLWEIQHSCEYCAPFIIICKSVDTLFPAIAGRPRFVNFFLSYYIKIVESEGF